jgi:hypothetical protein
MKENNKNFILNKNIDDNINKMVKGEMTASEVRNLVRQHNAKEEIKISGKTKSAMIEELGKLGYKIDHSGKKIVRGKTTYSVSDEGKRKLQKRTKKKMLKEAGEAPVLTKTKSKKKPPPIPPNVKGKKKKPDRSKIIAGY